MEINATTTCLHHCLHHSAKQQPTFHQADVIQRASLTAGSNTNSDTAQKFIAIYNNFHCDVLPTSAQMNKML